MYSELDVFSAVPVKVLHTGSQVFFHENVHWILNKSHSCRSNVQISRDEERFKPISQILIE
jgi:hypothetical protein